MSIHEFYAKFVGGERSALFQALRRLSLLRNPSSIVSPALTGGWPRWEQAEVRGAR